MFKVSFYSYKGGSGRSTTAWNTIQRLVEICRPTPKEPFVIADTDTESAGLTYLFNADSVFSRKNHYVSIQKRVATREVVNYATATEEGKQGFFKGMYPVGSFFGLEEEASVLLIGVDVDRKSMADTDMSGETQAAAQIQNFRDNIVSACRYCGAKALFFDTPSGTQHLARMSVYASDAIVCCMRPTAQFRKGTMTQLVEFLRNMVGRKVARKYILTPSAVCVDKGQEFNLNGQDYKYPQTAKERIKTDFCAEKMEEELQSLFAENVVLDMLEPTPEGIKLYADSEDSGDVFGIPEVKRFKWFEACLGTIPESVLSANDKMGLNRYEYLARIILKVVN